MKTRISKNNLRIGLLTAALLTICGCVTTTNNSTGTANGPVTLKAAFKGKFYVGVAINRNIATGNPGRRAELNNKDIELTKQQFNQISPENDLKWEVVQPNPGPQGFDFAPADAYVDFGMKNGMYIVGHTLIWHSQTPGWVFAGTNMPPGVANNAAPAAAVATNTVAATPGGRGGGRGFGGGGGGFGGGGGRGGGNGPRASREELLARMREHIMTVVGRYKGKIKVWDVVNEAIADGAGTNIFRNDPRGPWFAIIGPDFIAKAFQYAHEADPDAILRYNDYGLENPAKRAKLITLIKQLQADKIPVGAIGTQVHVNVSTTFEQMDAALTEIETLGLPIHVTELDVNTAAAGQRGTGADVAGNAAATQGGAVDNASKRLSDAYAGLFRAFVKHKKSVKVVTFWGANDAVSWRRGGSPLLFDGDDNPKPAFDAVIAESKK